MSKSAQAMSGGLVSLSQVTCKASSSSQHGSWEASAPAFSLPELRFPAARGQTRGVGGTGRKTVHFLSLVHDLLSLREGFKMFFQPLFESKTGKGTCDGSGHLCAGWDGGRESIDSGWRG